MFSSNIGSPASNCLDWPGEDYCVVSTYCQAGPGSRLRVRATDLLATSTVELAVILCWFGTYELVVDLVELPGLPVPVECTVCLGNSQICRSTITFCLISFSDEGISNRKLEMRVLLAILTRPQRRVRRGWGLRCCCRLSW